MITHKKRSLYQYFKYRYKDLSAYKKSNYIVSNQNIPLIPGSCPTTANETTQMINIAPGIISFSFQDKPFAL